MVQAVVRSNPRELIRKALVKKLQLLAPKHIRKHQVRVLRTLLPTMSLLKLVKSKLRVLLLRMVRKLSLFHLHLNLVSERLSLLSRNPMRKSALLPPSLPSNPRDRALKRPVASISMTLSSPLQPINPSKSLEAIPTLRIQIKRSQFLANRAMLHRLQKTSNLRWN